MKGNMKVPLGFMAEAIVFISGPGGLHRLHLYGDRAEGSHKGRHATNNVTRVHVGSDLVVLFSRIKGLNILSILISNSHPAD